MGFLENMEESFFVEADMPPPITTLTQNLCCSNVLEPADHPFDIDRFQSFILHRRPNGFLEIMSPLQETEIAFLPRTYIHIDSTEFTPHQIRLRVIGPHSKCNWSRRQYRCIRPTDINGEPVRLFVECDMEQEKDGSIKGVSITFRLQVLWPDYAIACINLIDEIGLMNGEYGETLRHDCNECAPRARVNIASEILKELASLPLKLRFDMQRIWPEGEPLRTADLVAMRLQAISMVGDPIVRAQLFKDTTEKPVVGVYEEVELTYMADSDKGNADVFCHLRYRSRHQRHRPSAIFRRFCTSILGYTPYALRHDTNGEWREIALKKHQVENNQNETLEQLCNGGFVSIVEFFSYHDQWLSSIVRRLNQLWQKLPTPGRYLINMLQKEYQFDPLLGGAPDQLP